MDQDIQNFAFAIHDASLIHRLAVDRDKHLIEMPAHIGGRMRSTDLSGIGEAKLDRAASDSFIQDIYATPSQQVFYISKAEKKSKIQPDGVPDDLDCEAIAAIA